MDLRCKNCNWLNKEVKEEFVCKNCGLENIKEYSELEEIVIPNNKKDSIQFKKEVKK